MDLENHKEMKLNQLLLAALFALVLCSCGSDNDPEPNTHAAREKYATLSIVSGDGQTGTFSSLLDDSLIMQVATAHEELALNRFYLKASVVNGNGSVNSDQWSSWPDISLPSANGKFKATWKLGCDGTTQSVRFYLFHMDSCNFIGGAPANCAAIDSVTFSATVSLGSSSGWVKICGIDWVDSYNTKIRTFGDEIYAVNQGSLYKLKDGVIRYWEELSNVPYRAYDFGFDSQGTLYILTEENGIFVTEDQNHWKSYGTGILDTRYPIGFLVEDSVVYASFHFDGMYRLRKNSDFARKLLIDGKYYEEYAFPARHPNGDLYVIDKWDNYWTSSNSGDSWTALSIEWKYVNYETKDFKIHPSGLLYIGSGDASLAILSPTTYMGDLHKYYQWNGSSQHIENIQFNGKDVYYLVSHTTNPGIYSSTTGWQKINIGFEETISLFHRMKDGTFLIGSMDGIYYKAN